MDNTIIASIITGTATVIAAGLMAWATRPKMNEAAQNPSSDKKRNLVLMVVSSPLWWVGLFIASVVLMVYQVQSDDPLTKGTVLSLIAIYVNAGITIPGFIWTLTEKLR